ncbi:atypical SDR family protein [Candidatus Planktophila sulfonica]|uniref:Atypical SDR family protein n=1 Tax=Candidatus Planktophila sulfonica TaxID=1884904 RepID=A0A249KF34_9ACTN|nr:SDR family oxidoreductase [Candidatus Planktophila sulfonica]ASY15413.1 atypical SDR family protein [Candidatus Planktophila sulfonica]
MDTQNRLFLVTGASGYVGGRLVRDLLGDGKKVRVLVRDAKKIQGQSWANAVEIIEGNASNSQDLDRALAGVHTAYYLLHSINVATDFGDIEAAMAKGFAESAQRQNVAQIIYLGGIANDENRSRHLTSRMNTGTQLASTSVPVLELRAGIIIGSGSASFEMLRHLTHRLPIMTTPKWVSNRTQPIAIRDVLYYLRNVANLEKPVSRICDIGGPEVVTYAVMMQKFAEISGLRKRKIIQVPVLTPKLSSLWIGFVTPVPTSLARPLVESLISEVVVDSRKTITDLIPLPSEGLLTVSQAIQLALTRTAENSVDTRWSDAAFPTAPWQKAQSDPDWAGELTLKDHREITTEASIAKVWEQIEGIGGERGWFGSGWLWYLRGVLDRIVGGVGLRRGRRDPQHLRIGDSLDFWRVEGLEHGKHLRLYAEMILPGKAWLEFNLTEKDGQTVVTQDALFEPRGLGGQIYWYVVSPFHFFIFPTMLRNIVKAARKS